MTPRFSGVILHHTQPITGKGLTDYDSSDDEDDALTYTLSMEDVRKVAQQHYIDFSAMFQRHQKNPYSGKEDQPKSQAQVDVGENVLCVPSRTLAAFPQGRTIHT